MSVLVCCLCWVASRFLFFYDLAMTTLIILFLGYAAGRFGHKYLNVWMKNPTWAPHHWIPAVFIVLLGLMFPENPYRWYLVAFGSGLFVSDLKDFLHFRFFEPDDDSPKRFWGID